MIKKVDFSTGQFEANGKTYFVQSGLTISRFEKYQKLEIEAAYPRSLADLQKEHEALYVELNKMRIVEACRRVYDLVRAKEVVGVTSDKWLRIAALFINTEDENCSDCSDDLLERKIDDWRKEGYDFSDFFMFAASTSRNLTEIYEKSTQIFSNDKEAAAAEQTNPFTSE